MKLRISVAARSRPFSKAMTRACARLRPLLDAFERAELKHPIHEAILVGVTDDGGPDFFREVPNRDGVFQVLAGCAEPTTDDRLAEAVFEILRRAVRLCPFADPDRRALDDLFERLRPAVLAN